MSKNKSKASHKRLESPRSHGVRSAALNNLNQGGRSALLDRVRSSDCARRSAGREAQRMNCKHLQQRLMSGDLMSGLSVLAMV
jgi:hypothetical protein